MTRARRQEIRRVLLAAVIVGFERANAAEDNPEIKSVGQQLARELRELLRKEPK